MTQPEFTELELRHIANQFVDYDYGLNAQILTKIKAVLPEPPVRCYHCRAEQPTEPGYEAHLRHVHQYGDEREDGAEATAWNAFHRRRV